MLAALIAAVHQTINPEKDSNMRKLSAAVLLAGVASLPFTVQAADSPHTFSIKGSLYSEYEYRGISQTSQDPALQLNLDYSHSSGFYLGFFATNIKWLEETAESLGGHTRGNLELDFFGGYKMEIAKDFLLDVGYLRYEYPRSDDFFTNPKVHTDEVYVGLSWGPLSTKYSYSINDTFGVPNSEGSDFLEANLAYPIDKWTITAHIGKQRYKNNSPLDYVVYKIGAVYDFGDGWNAGAYYKDTDVDNSAYTVLGQDWARGRLVAFVSKTF